MQGRPRGLSQVRSCPRRAPLELDDRWRVAQPFSPMIGDQSFKHGKLRDHREEGIRARVSPGPTLISAA